LRPLNPHLSRKLCEYSTRVAKTCAIGGNGFA
jgi:hypothetical protein